MKQNHYYPFGLKHESYNTQRLGYASYVDEDQVKRYILEEQPKFVGDGSYNYKYNGKEYQDELGLNTYSYGWREYDPAIGRFNRIDRFAEKYHSLSTYGYAGNNPVLFNDIQGDSIGIGRDLYDKFIENIQNRRSKIINDRQSRIDKAIAKGKTSKAESLRKKFAAQDARENSEMSVLNNTINELSVLESSSQVYNIFENFSGVPSTADGVTNYDTSTGAINIGTKGAFNMGVLAHEFKHAYQFQTGNLSFDASGLNGGNLYDLNDEYEAFDRGAFFGAPILSRSEIDNIYMPRGVPSGNRNLSTQAGNFSGAPTIGDQMRNQTTRNVLRGTAQQQFYIGSSSLVNTINKILSIKL